MTPLRAGVIGVGHLGQHHARLYAAIPGSQLAGIMDLSPDRAKAVADKLGTRVFPDIGELLPHVDVVSVAVPTSAHHAVAKACLSAGKHVLVEKPIAVTSAEARELVQLAKERGLCLQVGHSERFNPVMQVMRPHIGRPAFVDTMLRNWIGFPGRSLVVLSGRDVTATEFDQLVRRTLSWPVVTGSSDVTLLNMRDADHTFSARKDKARLGEAILAWLLL